MKITDVNGEEIVVRLPQVIGVRPVGSQVIIEVLTAKELNPTKLHLPVETEEDVGGAPQAYVVGVGPQVHAEFGIKEGDRVVLSGTFVPIPEKLGRNGRKLGAVEPHVIKAVLAE